MYHPELTRDKKQEYITNFKEKLSITLHPNSDKSIKIRKLIGSLLLDMGIPPLNFSNDEVDFVLEFLMIPNLTKLVVDKRDNMKGMISVTLARQLVLRDYLNPGDISKIDETIEDEEFIKKPKFATQNIHGSTVIPKELKKGQTYIKGHTTKEYMEHYICRLCEKKKDNISAGTGSCFECDASKQEEMNKKHFPKESLTYKKTDKFIETKKVKLVKRKVNKNWRVMPRAVLTGDYEHDSTLCTEMIDDLYYIKDNLKGKDSKFFEVVDMINQYQYALRSVDFEEKARIKQEHFDQTHYELLDAMKALTKVLESEVQIFEDVEINMTQKGLDAVGDPVEVSMINAIIAGTGISKEILTGTIPGTTPKDSFKETVKKLEKKREKQLDLIIDTQISGKYSEPKPMEISTISYPKRLLFDENGKSIAFKNLSPEAQKELNSLRSKKAWETRRRNKLTATDKISTQPGDEY